MLPSLSDFRSARSVVPWFLLFFCCFCLSLQAAGPTVVLSVGHFNTDTIADTLYGERSGARTFLPRAIHWGSGGSTVTRTAFVLPSWSDLSGSCAVSDINSDSTLDVIFYLRGDSAGLPVSRSLVVAGGGLLDQQTSVDISALASSQSSPFVTRDLVKGHEFTDEAMRDLLGRNSYLLSVSFGSPLPSVLTGVQEQAPWKMMLYPNPSGRMVTLQGSGLVPGEYLLHILSLQGVSLYEQLLTVGMTGEYTSALDLHSLTSGTYIVRLSGLNTNQRYSTSLVFIR
jgi:hypothetical protein